MKMMTNIDSKMADLIGELQKKNMELTRLNEIKNDFIRMAAHDLRNPLQAINLCCEAILEVETIRKQPNLVDMVNNIKYLSGFSHNLVSDLLDIENVETNKLIIDLLPVEMNSLLKETIEANRFHANKKRVLLELKTKKECFCYADASRIKQVLNNLLVNAIKFSPADTEITVELTEMERQLLVTVSDFGLGIPEEEMDKLFRPFTQLSNQPRNSEKGNGIGLFICKKIIESHHGQIWAENKKTPGFRICFTLPLT